MLPLAYAPAWIAASLLLVAGVVFASLMPGPPAPLDLRHFDKLEHALAYAVLAVWFTGIVPRANYWKVPLVLAALGIAIEFLQRAMPFGRTGDPWDFAANVLGIAVGVAFATWRTGGWALKVEAWLGRN
jgi:VanZ family protein